MYTHLVVARSSVLRRDNDAAEAGANGFLYLARRPTNPADIALCWMPAARIPPPETAAFLAAASMTDADRAAAVTFTSKLGFSRGEEACVQVLVVGLQDGSSWPELWIDALRAEQQPPGLAPVVNMVRSWLRRLGRDLVECDVPNIFFLSDRLAAMSRWPPTLPQPGADSTIYRAGALGMGVISSVVGRPIATKIEDVGWSMLEQFAKVTAFAKSKTSEALEHPLARPLLPLIPEQVRSYFLSSAEAEALLREYDSAGHYLARFSNEIQNRLRRRNRPEEPAPAEISEFVDVDQTRAYEVISAPYQSHFSGMPLTLEEWKSWHDEAGSVEAYRLKFFARIFTGGIEPAARREAWKFLVGAHAFASTALDRSRVDRDRAEQYANLKLSWQHAIQASEEEASAGMGLSPSPNSGPVGDENENADPLTKVRERKYRIEKDVVRTDRNTGYFAEAPADVEQLAGLKVGPHLFVLRDILMTYTILNFDLGYVQGMSDLCSPILEIMDDEIEAFWTFSHYMERMKSHFARDQLGMQRELRRLELLVRLVDPPLYRHMELTDSVNMFCCFRWLLICFKREFPFSEIKTLWEVILACPLSEHFQIFVAAAILNMHRTQIFHQRAFDEVLKFINGLSDTIPVPDSIQHAQVLYYLARDLVKKYAPTDIVASLETIPSVELWLENTAGSAVDGSADSGQLLLAWEGDMDSWTPEEWQEVVQLFAVPK
ncbi:GTPase activating protein [Polyrhizophydium stewartii]|uniref:GTPase activating protein n=1 Tax=Polyrhizophydium stewartii TaxID=2732419 RepID=A0ABR4NIM7_9FUNG